MKIYVVIKNINKQILQVWKFTSLITSISKKIFFTEIVITKGGNRLNETKLKYYKDQKMKSNVPNIVPISYLKKIPCCQN